jgi:nucleotide-binding universal stress UspA family protein
MAAQRIVVGVDGSPGAERALRWALSLAERTGGTVRAVMAWDYPPLALPPHPVGLLAVPPSGHMEAATAEALDGALAPVEADTGQTIERVVRRGASADVLVAEAAEADLVVVGTRGRGTVKSVVLGSVSRRVAAVAPCAVAVVPGTLDHDPLGPVLVGVDGSSGSLAALRWAGTTTDGPIRALHVFEYPFGPEYAVDGFEWDDPSELGEQVLQRSVEEALGDRPDVTTTAVGGDPRQILVEEGAGAAMIVVGARGAGGIGGLLLGSITTGVAARARTPVVVVPDR